MHITNTRAVLKPAAVHYWNTADNDYIFEHYITTVCHTVGISQITLWAKHSCNAHIIEKWPSIINGHHLLHRNERLFLHLWPSDGDHHRHPTVQTTSIVSVALQAALSPTRTVFPNLTAVISPTHWGIYQFLNPNCLGDVKNRITAAGGHQWVVEAEQAGLSAGSLCIVVRLSTAFVFLEVKVEACSVFTGWRFCKLINPLTAEGIYIYTAMLTSNILLLSDQTIKNIADM